MLNCPKCVGKLEEKAVENVNLDVCWVCEGIWFDSGELEKVLNSDSKDFDRIDMDRKSLDGKEATNLREDLDKTTGKCPRCGDETMLQRIEYKNKEGLYVDVCPKGHGIWFDSGEIHEVRDRSKVDWADKMYSFKTGFWNCLKLYMQGPFAWKKMLSVRKEGKK